MKSRRVLIKTRPTPASLPLKGQVTKNTTVKWTIAKARHYLSLETLLTIYNTILIYPY